MTPGRVATRDRHRPNNNTKIAKPSHIHHEMRYARTPETRHERHINDRTPHDKVTTPHHHHRRGQQIPRPRKHHTSQVPSRDGATPKGRAHTIGVSAGQGHTAATTNKDRLPDHDTTTLDAHGTTTPQTRDATGTRRPHPHDVSRRGHTDHTDHMDHTYDHTNEMRHSDNRLETRPTSDRQADHATDEEGRTTNTTKAHDHPTRSTRGGDARTVDRTAAGRQTASHHITQHQEDTCGGRRCPP